jgi:2-succinyl-5-enolpyruvyl-6-hydroxy-3-cyclohexene-1-carboxylate synthase
MPEGTDPRRGDVQATFAATLVDEWVRAGITDAVLCPGSRSTPLALALATRPELRVHVRLDERGAGFFGLGLALATGRPAVLCVTSGTAAAELHPAVVEADLAGVPLLVCTADRPPELHGVGAAQTIEQEHLYQDALRWSASPGVPEPGAAWSWRSLGARAVLEARDGPLGPGPVQLNLAFGEPLVGRAGTLPDGRPGAAPWHRSARTRPPGVPGAIGAPASGRGLLLAGAGAGPPEAVLALAEHLGWPVLADPLSGCRRTRANVIAAADAIARVAPARLRPDVVVRLGGPWASKALPAFLAGAEVLAVDPWWRWEDPSRDAAVLHRADPATWLDAARGGPAPPAADGWLEGWREAERRAQAAIEAAIGALGLTEPLVARRLLGAVPAGAVVLVSSSMPRRDLEWFAPPLDVPPRVLANRGANGIDGVVSTAVGLAAAGQGPVLALVGDLAFLHDVGAVVTASAGAFAGSCTVLVVDNGGGGIFEMLPQATATDRDLFDRVFGTPQETDVARLAEALGVLGADVGDEEELRRALAATVGRPGLSVVRARVPARPGNVEAHERVHASVRRALGVAG